MQDKLSFGSRLALQRGGGNLLSIQQQPVHNSTLLHLLPTAAAAAAAHRLDAALVLPHRKARLCAVVHKLPLEDLFRGRKSR